MSGSVLNSRHVWRLVGAPHLHIHKAFHKSRCGRLVRLRFQGVLIDKCYDALLDGELVDGIASEVQEFVEHGESFFVEAVAQ